ncbi:MAG: ABC transporter permease [Gemmatimonadota bacterium]
MTLIQDIRFALRTLRRSPGFTLVAATTIGLGVGAVGAVLSIANTFLWRPLPVRAPERLALIYAQRTATGEYQDFSYADYLDLQHAAPFEGMIAYTAIPVSIGVAGAGERVYGELVSGNYFDFLGVSPALGRGFNAEEGGSAGGPPVVVVSDGFYRARLGADPRELGRTIRINGHEFTVIGVAPPEFHGIYYVGFSSQFWVPVTQYSVLTPGTRTRLDDRGQTSLRMMGRLRPGTTVEQASQAVAAIASRLATEFPATNAGLTAEAILERDARPEAGPLAAGTRLLFRILLGVGALVVLVAAANVTSLLLARAISRQREIALRLALGASRRRLLAQLFTESLVLALLGGVLGVGFAVAAGGALAGAVRFPTDIPFALDFPLDFRVLGWTAVATLLAAIGFGLLPALQSSNPSLVSTLKDGGGGGQGRRRAGLRSALVVGQVAVSCLLLVGTGLGLRTLLAMRQVKPGFDTDSMLLVSVNPALAGYDGPRSARFYATLLEGARRLPGVADATLAGALPLEFLARDGGLFVDGAESQGTKQNGELAGWSSVSPGYFTAIGTRLLEGREFLASDDSGAAPVAIVSEALARHSWPGRSAIGQRVRIGAADARPTEVIGVAADVKVRRLTEAPQLYVYRPIAQDPVDAATLVLRTSLAPLSLAPAVRELVGRLDPDIPVADIKTFDDLLQGRALLFPRFAAVISGALGGLALLLAVVGLYGLVAYTVSQRRRELGIRVALGATGLEIARLVMANGMRLASLGVGIGIAAAMGLAQVVSGLLFGVSPTDSLVLAVVAFLLVFVALSASYIPARRAARVDPMVALRSE